MRKKLLIVIILISALFRFWSLGTNPPSLNWDEVAIGYNAWSILKTGHDEFGKFLPTTFRSFDDYKSPAYIYTTIVSIFTFGKNEFAIRFPSALFGLMTIPALYLLAKEILTKYVVPQGHEQTIWYNRAANMAVLSTAMFAFTPWHIHFSRVAFEANFALFWEVLGSYFFLRWISLTRVSQNTEKSNIWRLLAAVISFSLAIHSYGNARLFVPLLLLGWVVYYLKPLLRQWKSLIVATLLGLLLTSPLLLQLYDGTAFARYNGTSILNRPEIYEKNKIIAQEDFFRGYGFWSSKVHNVRIPVTQTIVNNYGSHFNFSFLFLRSDLPRHQIPGFGLLHIWQFPLILAGIIFIIKQRSHMYAFLPLWWLFVAPIPAALTWQVPHSIRTEVMLPPLAICAGVGLWVVLRWIQSQDLKMYTRKASENTLEKLIHLIKWLFPKALFLGILGTIGLSLIATWIGYFVHLPPEMSAAWLYGRKEMVQYVQQNEAKYQRVVVSLKLDWSYLWFLWYGNYDPQKYLEQGGTIGGSFDEDSNKIGKIEFHNFDYSTEKLQPDTLMIGSPKDFPSEIVPEYKINDLSGKPIIYIVKS